MFTKLFGYDSNGNTPANKEGDLFKVIKLHGTTFEIRYGYYEDIDRQYDPYEVYPDFIKEPMYTNDGYPFVTLMQSPCEHFDGHGKGVDHDCGSCIYMERGDELIAVCRCPQNKKLE